MLSLTQVINPQPNWYRGDFHAHTCFSNDGHYLPTELADLALSEGLDFFTITDHNTINALANCQPHPHVVIIPGIEVTLTIGHFNVLGLHQETAWLKQLCANPFRFSLNGQYPTPTDLMVQTATEGLLNSINHPRRNACNWRDEGTDLRHVHCLEIWNKPSFPENVQANCEALLLWTKLLNDGHRLIGIGGSDYHLPIPEPYQTNDPERLGQPSTYVFARELSGAAILAGLQQGRAYVSMGAQVAFYLEFGKRIYHIGDDLGLITGPVQLSAMVCYSPAAGYARLVKNGEVLIERPVAADGSFQLSMKDQLEATKSVWYRFDLLDEEGQLLAVTNPIFAGPQSIPQNCYFGDFV